MKTAVILAALAASAASVSAAAPTAKPATYHQPIKIERQWRNYCPGHINFQITSPETKGAQIYKAIIPNPDEYIPDNARRVLQTLYFSPSARRAAENMTAKAPTGRLSKVWPTLCAWPADVSNRISPPKTVRAAETG